MVIPLANQEAKLWPAEPLSLMLIVSSGSPSSSHTFETSLDNIVPTTLLVFFTGSSILTFSAFSIAFLLCLISSWSKAFSSPWS